MGCLSTCTLNRMLTLYYYYDDIKVPQNVKYAKRFNVHFTVHVHALTLVLGVVPGTVSLELAEDVLSFL